MNSIKHYVYQMRKHFNFLIVIFFVLPFYSSATTLTSNGTGGGNWINDSSWDGANNPGDLNDGDTLVILLGDTITISSPTTTFNGVIQIYGVLVFDGGKLTMDATSSIQLASGSDIISLSPGANDQIRIGDANNKISGDEIDDLTTPNQLTDGSLTGGGCAVTLDCDDDPLPVEVIYFKGSNQNGNVKIEWATSMEENFDFFTLERSSDGRYFQDYGKIFSRTTYSEVIKKYEFIDEMPFSGLSYYRLKATDFDGSFEYHGVVAVTMEKLAPNLLLYPNPITGQHVTISYSGETETVYQILKITGEIVDTGMIKPGVNAVNFKYLLESGIYFFNLEGNNISRKFIVQ